MQRFVSAVFLIILFFNLAGYRVVAHFLEQRLDAQLEARLDVDQYDEAQLIQLKIPLHLPYQTAWANFERCDGEIKRDGITYKYVKRKLSGDTLYLKCIPYTSGMHLEAAKNDFLKNNSDLAQSNPSKKTGDSKSAGLKKSSGEWEHPASWAQAYRLVPLQPFPAIPVTEKIITIPHGSPEQPPDLSFA